MTRLAGVTDVSDGVRLLRAMAPVPAAAAEGATLPTVAEHVARVRALAAGHDLVLVEGAGGLLVALDDAGATLAELAAALPGAAVVVVCRSGLGTLNHTTLTLEALERRGTPAAGTVIGSWPAVASEVETSNRWHLASLADPAARRRPRRRGGSSARRLPRRGPGLVRPPAVTCRGASVRPRSARSHSCSHR